MQKFIGVRLVDAQPMTRGEYNTLRGWTLPADEDPKDPGYLVRAKSGQTNWFPQAEFVKEHMAIVGEDNKVSQKDVDAFIKQIHVSELEPNDIGTKVTTVTVTLANGFTLTETSACVDPKNHDPEIGLMCCMEKIEDKIWFLLGFLMSSGVNGFQKGVMRNGRQR